MYFKSSIVNPWTLAAPKDRLDVNIYCTCVRLCRVSVDADVVDDGARLEDGLHLAQRHVLPELQLHQVLLPVDYLQGPVSLIMVSGFKFTTLGTSIKLQCL